jgi:hypothetical protein
MFNRNDRAGCHVLRVADRETESKLLSVLRIVSRLAEKINSIFCKGPRAVDSEWMYGSARSRNRCREAQVRLRILPCVLCPLPCALRHRSSLDKDLS